MNGFPSTNHKIQDIFTYNFQTSLLTLFIFFDFLKLFTGDPTFLSSFCDIVVRPSEKARFIVLCNILVDFFESQGHSVKLICWAISQEFQRHSHCTNPNLQ